MSKIFFIKTLSLSLLVSEHLGIPLAMYHSKYFPWTFIKTPPILNEVSAMFWYLPDW